MKIRAKLMALATVALLDSHAVSDSILTAEAQSTQKFTEKQSL